MRARLLTGDVGEVLPTLPDASVRCCVTSPPYWGLRDYGVTGQIGLEKSPEEYVAKLVVVFQEVRRVLTDDGTLWLNLGDSYASAWPAPNSRRNIIGNPMTGGKRGPQRPSKLSGDLKEKDLIGIPWLVAFALRADGWYLRSDIIWSKPNPMPESVQDRPTKSHEYLFLLSKAARYYFDAESSRELSTTTRPALLTFGDRPDVGHPGHMNDRRRSKKPGGWATHLGGHGSFHKNGREKGAPGEIRSGRNCRSVWTIATQAYPEAHFATFPEELASRCIRAGSAPSDTVLDPFSGSGTTAAIAIGLGRSAIGIELNPKYQELARQRIGPMLCEVA